MDAKHQVNFECFRTTTTHHIIQGCDIWVVDDFFTATQCRQVCQCVQDKLEPVVENGLRTHDRAITFDNNNGILPFLQDNLPAEFRDSTKAPPCGFHDIKTWDEKNIFLNPCLRISRHQPGDSGLGWHRDASYVQNHLVRSSHTFLLYLTSGASLTFAATNAAQYGLSNDEEQQYISDTLTIQTTNGMLVIFDQRLFHKGDVSDNEKWTLRTDIVRPAKVVYNDKTLPTFDRPPSDNERVAKCLFRTAQLLELKGSKDNKTSELYARVISLRVGGADAPMIEGLQQIINAHKQDYNQALGCGIVMNEWDAMRHEFTVQYATLETLKICALFVIMSATMNLLEDTLAVSDIFKRVIAIVSDKSVDSLVEQFDCSTGCFGEHEPWYGDLKSKLKDIDLEMEEASDFRQLKEECLPTEDFIANSMKLKWDDIKNIVRVKHSNPIGAVIKSCHVKAQLNGCYCSLDGSRTGPTKNTRLLRTTELKVCPFVFHIEVDPSDSSSGDIGKSGKLWITYPGASFNHASCNCEFTNIDILSVKDECCMLSTTVEYLLSENQQQLTLLHLPSVIM